jgi:putative ABC transport system substrate-binding protein
MLLSKHTRRREFITLLGGAAAAWPVVAQAQQSERLRQIGLLVSGAENDPEMQARVAAILQGFARFGWIEGRNVHVTSRYASANVERAILLAKELVALQPDVIISFGNFPTRALKRETNAIPIVFVGVPDPIGEGFVASLARSGGNLTGTLLNEPSVVGKWLAMLKEFAPQLARVAVLFNPKTSPYPSVFRETAETVARSLAIELVPREVTDADDIERAILDFARVSNGGLLIPPDLTAVSNRDLIIELAARHRLPAVYQARFWVSAGGLMSYGANRVAEHRQAAYYVDRILRGAHPSILPVQAPIKYETLINLKAAKALGLTVPSGLLVAADEVIE